MGIVNITPDSFYDGGKYIDHVNAIEHALKIVEQGADIIDIGGESSRPGAEKISVNEELERVIPVIKALNRKIQIPISIDTTKAVIAKEAIKSGAVIVNDITALKGDSDMAKVVADNDVKVILMHMQGDPKTMQVKPHYDDVIDEITSFLKERISWAIENGIKRENIIIDPGVGFGKTLEHNLLIIKNLSKFKALGVPVLIGPSRKSFIGTILKVEPNSRLWGTAGVVALCAASGADIIRVHDVLEMKQVTQMTEAII